jgi:hypothetical protein
MSAVVAIKISYKLKNPNLNRAAKIREALVSAKGKVLMKKEGFYELKGTIIIN